MHSNRRMLYAKTLMWMTALHNGQLAPMSALRRAEFFLQNLAWSANFQTVIFQSVIVKSCNVQFCKVSYPVTTCIKNTPSEHSRRIKWPKQNEKLSDQSLIERVQINLAAGEDRESIVPGCVWGRQVVAVHEAVRCRCYWWLKCSD